MTEQKQELASQGETLGALAQQIQDVRVNIAQNASARNDTRIYMSPLVAAEEAKERVREEGLGHGGTRHDDDGFPAGEDARAGRSAHHSDKSDRGHISKADGRPQQSGDGTGLTDEATRAALEEQEILRRYGWLDPYIALGRGEPIPGPLRGYVAELQPWEQAVVRQWYRKWIGQIDLVRSVRNAVAHPPARVTPTDREGTIELLHLLANDLNGAMRDAEQSAAGND